MEEKRTAGATRVKTLKQLIESKAELESRMKENLFHSVREKMTKDILCLSGTPDSWIRPSLC